jgi:hypothetical protein
MAPSRAPVPALVLALLALAAPPARADAAAEAVAHLQDSLSMVTSGLSAAAGLLAEGQRAAAGNSLHLSSALAVDLAADAADPAIAEPMGIDADRVARAALALSRTLVLADAAAADPRKSDAAVLRRVKKAAKKANAVGAAFRRVPTLGPVVILEEVKTRSAGFHKPGQEVLFRARVYPPGSCTGPMEAEVIDTAAVHGKTSVFDAGLRTVQPEVPFAVAMGPDTGAARVVLSGCGRTSVRLLYNYGGKKGGGDPPPKTEVWDFGLVGDDEFVLGGFPYPTYAMSFSFALEFHGDLVKSLRQSVPDPVGTGMWTGIEFPTFQQPEPSIVRLLDSEIPGRAVTAEVWWSTTVPSIHVRSDFDIIPHRFRWTWSGTEDSIPVQAVQLDVTSIGTTAISGGWFTVGGGSMSGNSSSGTWNAAKRP